MDGAVNICQLTSGAPPLGDGSDAGGSTGPADFRFSGRLDCALCCAITSDRPPATCKGTCEPRGVHISRKSSCAKGDATVTSPARSSLPADVARGDVAAPAMLPA